MQARGTKLLQKHPEEGLGSSASTSPGGSLSSSLAATGQEVPVDHVHKALEHWGDRRNERSRAL